METDIDKCLAMSLMVIYFMVDDCLNQNKDIGFDQQILIFKNVCARSRMPFMFMQCFCNVCRFWERSRNRLQEKDLQKTFFQVPILYLCYIIIMSN